MRQAKLAAAMGAIGMHGRFQDEDRIGVFEAALPGRQQCLGGRPELWVDVAHNPDAGRALARGLARRPVPGR